jgi:hypothetical protein
MRNKNKCAIAEKCTLMLPYKLPILILLLISSYMW